MKAREIYNHTLALLHEQGSTGYQTDAFERIAPSLLNLLCGLLYDLDLRIKNRKFHENQTQLAPITSLDDEVHLHPLLCQSVLPMGLAFLLINEEDTERAALFFNLYRTEKDALYQRTKRARRHKITSVY